MFVFIKNWAPQYLVNFTAFGYLQIWQNLERLKNKNDKLNLFNGAVKVTKQISE